MKTIIKVITILALIVPIIVVFHSFFKSGPLSFGDAPFFYPEGLKELISEPLAWTNRGLNFGGLNLLIWISPLTIIYGILGSLFKLGNDLAIRIIFYFPSVILSFVGVYLLSRYLKFSKVITFFTILIYILNTYFLLVIDGGQVGIALAYGLFPLSILFIKKVLDKPSLNQYILSLIFLTLCSISDIRIAIISIATSVIWQFIEGIYKRNFQYLRNIWVFVLLILSWVGSSLYWLVPLINNNYGTNVISSNISFSNKLVDAFLLFSPHWPDNIFGQINSPSIYFIFIPLLISLPFVVSILSRKNRSYEFLPILVCYLIFCFLTVSAGLISKLPFGFSFRDTSKFFIPVALFTGILIGKSVEVVNKKIFTIIVYFYVLILIWPALFGRMNFVLSDRSPNSDLQKIYQNLKSDNTFYRTLWIPEKHPLAYEVVNNPALDGQNLVNFTPFAINNTGEDPFNFLNSDNFTEWFRLLGIKYAILSNDQRKISKTTAEINNWQGIVNLISENKNLEKQNWDTDIPVFKLKNTLPRIFSIEKMYGIVGRPINDPDIPALNYEDGIFDPTQLKELSTNAYSIVFNGGDITDLQMSLLQKYFVSAIESKKSDWAMYSHENYLKYKYELLIRDVKFEDFDYSKGIAFSTKSGEKIEFDFKVTNPGDYVMGIRSMSPAKGKKYLTWKFENLHLSSGTYKNIIENKNNFEIVNVVALIPKNEFDASLKSANELYNTFGTDISKINKSPLKYTNLDIENSGTLKYKIINPGNSYWIIFSDKYNSMWNLKTGDLYKNSYPAYSMINAFYFEPKWGDLEIQFTGQENVRWGIYASTLSGLIIVIVYLLLLSRNGKN